MKILLFYVKDGYNSIYQNLKKKVNRWKYSIAFFYVKNGYNSSWNMKNIRDVHRVKKTFIYEKVNSLKHYIQNVINSSKVMLILVYVKGTQQILLKSTGEEMLRWQRFWPYPDHTGDQGYLYIA